MSSLFDFDSNQDIAFQAKTAGKAIIAAKYDTIKSTGEFLFNAHSSDEFALRCEMIDEHLSNISRSRLANVSDSKMKLVKALHTEWSLRHAKCNCKLAKSTCEMCADGELDSDSPLCKACRGKQASRRIAAPASDLLAFIAPAAVGVTLYNTNKMRKLLKNVREHLGQDGDLTLHLETSDLDRPTKHNINHCDVCHSIDAVKKQFKAPDSLPDDWGKESSRKVAIFSSKEYGDSGKKPDDDEGSHYYDGDNDDDDSKKDYNKDGGSPKDKQASREPAKEEALHDKLHEEWHRKHGDSPCTSVEDCKRKSSHYKNSSRHEAGIHPSFLHEIGNGIIQIGHFIAAPLIENRTPANSTRHDIAALGEAAVGGGAAARYYWKNLRFPPEESSELTDQGGHVRNIGPDDHFYDWQKNPHTGSRTALRKNSGWGDFDDDVDDDEDDEEECPFCGESDSPITARNVPPMGQNDMLHPGGPERICDDCWDELREEGPHGWGDPVRPEPWDFDKKVRWPRNPRRGSRTANKYIEHRGDSWVILQKGTGKVLSHHDSKEKAEASFRAMMQSKHGSSREQW